MEILKIKPRIPQEHGFSLVQSDFSFFNNVSYEKNIKHETLIFFFFFFFTFKEMIVYKENITGI